MKNRKRTTITSLVLCAALLCGLLAACGGTTGEEKTTEPSTAPGAVDGELTVRIHQPNAEQTALWQSLAAEYKTLTGVNIVFSEDESTLDHLKEALKGDAAPNIILFSDPSEYQAWGDHAEDLSTSAAHKALLIPQLALKSEGKTVAVPLGVHAFGLIYSKPILQAYFDLEDKETEFTKIEDITDYDKLKSLVRDLTRNKAALEIDGAFAAPALKEGESAALSHRLLSMPMSYEMHTTKTELTNTAVNTLDFRYHEGYKNFVDLMFANGTAAADSLNARGEAGMLKEFTDGKAALLLGGTESWGRLNTSAAQTLKEDDIGLLPAFMDFDDNEEHGLALEPQLYAAVNAQASDEERMASAAFLAWLTGSDKGLSFISKELNLLAPYKDMTETLLPQNPLSADAFEQIKNGGAEKLHLVSATALSPGEEFREKTIAAGLNAYARGESSWEEFKSGAAEKWKEFREKLKY